VKQALELHGVNSEPYYLAIPLVGAYQESLGMNHNLLGSSNEAHFLVDDAGRAHLDRVDRGDSLLNVLAAAGYNGQDLTEGFSKAVEAAEGQGKVTPEESRNLVNAYQNALESYTYLED
jgi:arginine decarboxylase